MRGAAGRHPRRSGPGNDLSNYSGPEVMLNDFKCGCPIYLACGYTDLRRGIDGLAGLVQTRFQLDPFQNALFLFCGRRKDRLKGLYWEGDGFVLVYKRLESGSFQWPRNGEEARQLTPQQYRWLMEQLRLLKKKQSGSVKDVAPDNIPVEVVEHRLSEEERVCPQCGELMREIGTEARETLKLIPADHVQLGAAGSGGSSIASVRGAAPAAGET